MTDTAVPPKPPARKKFPPQAPSNNESTETTPLPTAANTGVKKKKTKKKPKKLKQKGFMLKLDGIFAGGGPPGMPPGGMPGGGGPPPWKKKKKTQAEDGEEEKNEGVPESMEVDTPEGKGARKGNKFGGVALPFAKKTPGEASPEVNESPKVNQSPTVKESPKEQNLNVVDRKPKMAGKKKKRKKMKFDAKKTTFSSQPVRQYKKTDYKATALKLTEKQRLEVMNMVKTGKMSVDQAMEAVLKHDANVREALESTQSPELHEVKKRKFDKKQANADAADMSKLTDEQRMKVINLVKDGKYTVPEAIAKVCEEAGVKPAASEPQEAGNNQERKSSKESIVEKLVCQDQMKCTII